MKILPEESLLVVVDVQEKLFTHMADKERLLAKLITLVEGMKALDVTVLAARQYPQGLGDVVEPLKPYFTGCYDKMTFSCCGEKNFLSALEASGRKRIIVAGIEAHVCVLQTVLDLKQLGYTPVLVADAISSRSEFDAAMALRRAEAEGALLTTVEAILFELCRQAGSEVFRTISRLVK